MALNKIIVKNANEHNLKNVSVEIPKNQFVVFTGVSGSGKSSLAMDTVYAEGQRRYVESLSSYARQFLGVLGKPDVESIDGLSPAIAIDQKTTSKNPRSTVGTITEVYDFLRLLYARVGHPHCPECNREVSRQSTQQMVNSILETIQEQPEFRLERGTRFFILSPVIKDKKGEFGSLFKNLYRQGIVRARIDGHFRDLKSDISLIKTNRHTVDGVISRHIASKKRFKDEEYVKEFETKIRSSIETSLRLSNGYAKLLLVKDASFDFSESPVEVEESLFSENFACAYCNISLPEIEPRTFSFNSPHGACPECEGIGTQLKIDKDLLINKDLSVKEGGIIPWHKIMESSSWTGNVVDAVAVKYKINLTIPIKKLKKEKLDILLYGVEEKITVSYINRDGRDNTYNATFEGVINNLERRYRETNSDYMRNEIEKYMLIDPCPKCLGTRLKDQALSVVIDKKNIAEITDLSIEDFAKWMSIIPAQLNERETKISGPILKEITYRTDFLLNVGLNYLTWNRSSGQLSGGEAQRIRLASQIGTGLSGVLYVLDEPSIGLHQRDQAKLIDTLKHLRDLGNSVIVVEHDTDTMLECDHILDFGPGAGERGGMVVAQGTPEELMKDKNSKTGPYLSGKKKVGDITKDSIKKQTKDPKQEFIHLLKASGHNLKNIDLNIPLGKFICVTGVSGSGKSTLVMDTFLRGVRNFFGLKNSERALDFKSLSGMENIDKVISIDQSPIGRTPKSNPATYTKTFDHIRDLFAFTSEAKIRGYKKGRFSFNVKGGRCEACQGAGQIKIEMQFMPDVYVNCEVCEGKRYNREALEITYKEKTISDVLNMTIEDALTFFSNIPQLRSRLETLYDVGLGYIRLGQPAPTLSGGEAQRVKLALELSKRSTGKTLYILDEPTTGLHFSDLERLVTIIKRLTAKGNTVLVIEHNIELIANSDWVIDLGPEGGNKGGQIIYEGPLSGLLNNKLSHTAQAVRELLKRY